MGKPVKGNLKEKFAGLYRENKFSPLFTTAAELEYEKGNLSGAVDILKNGLKIYPEYSTAYILLGKTYLEANDFQNAEEFFRKGCSLLNSKESLNYYITEIEKRKRHESLKQSTERISEKPSEKDTIENEKLPVIEDFAGSDISDEDELDELVKKIDNAKIDLNNDENETIIIQPEDSMKESGIVSETLAKIYISQGKFKEALEVYKKLLVNQPEKKDYYSARISEIESQISGMDW